MRKVSTSNASRSPYTSVTDDQTKLREPPAKMEVAHQKAPESQPRHTAWKGITYLGRQHGLLDGRTCTDRPPYRTVAHFIVSYHTRLAVRVISTALSALDTGQFCFASAAVLSKVAASIPGTEASVTRSILVIAKPPGPAPNCTLAVV